MWRKEGGRVSKDIRVSRGVELGKRGVERKWWREIIGGISGERKGIEERSKREGCRGGKVWKVEI